MEKKPWANDVAGRTEHGLTGIQRYTADEVVDDDVVAAASADYLRRVGRPDGHGMLRLWARPCASYLRVVPEPRGGAA